MSREAIPQLSDIEKLAVLEEEAQAIIASLKTVGSKEEFYPLEEATAKIVEKLEELTTKEAGGVIDHIVREVTRADQRISGTQGGENMEDDDDEDGWTSLGVIDQIIKADLND